ncbi:MAG TPA: hypothetical protein VFJ50_09890, partial [Gemmatimonadales bacterium]|nr:hypothetical protein [Gemmatimonadales bacterium]
MRRLEGPARAVAVATGTMVVLLAVALTITVMLQQRAVGKYRAAVREADMAGTVIGRLRSNLYERAAAVAEYAVYGDSEGLAAVDRLRSEFNTEVERLAATDTLSAADDARLEKLSAASEQRYREVTGTLVPAVGTSRLKAALRRYASANARVRQQADALAKRVAAEATDDRDQAERDSRRARVLALVAGLSTIVAAVLLALYSVRLINRLAGRIRATVSGLGLAAAEMRSASTQAAAATAEQSAAIAEVTAASEELSATATAIAENARSGANAAEQTGATMHELEGDVAGIA